MDGICCIHIEVFWQQHRSAGLLIPHGLFPNCDTLGLDSIYNVTILKNKLKNWILYPQVIINMRKF